MELLYWHWIVFGMLLSMAEMFLLSFAILWFGLGAILVGLLLLLFPEMTLTQQILIWTVSSSAAAVLWFKYLKPQMTDRTKAGISREAVMGTVGHVLTPPVDEKRGVVRFTTPLLGDDEWPFICDAEVTSGDRVAIKDVSGNTLIVEKRP